MVHLAQVRQFVHHHVIEQRQRVVDQAPVQADRAVAVRRSPQGAGAAQGELAPLHAQARRIVVQALGEQVLGRIGDLSAAIYDVNWYQMRVSDRKSIQLMLVMSQNLRGFNGIFNEVNMETFKTVCACEKNYFFVFSLKNS